MPSCYKIVSAQIENGSIQCPNCHHRFNQNPVTPPSPPSVIESSKPTTPQKNHYEIKNWPHFLHWAGTVYHQFGTPVKNQIKKDVKLYVLGIVERNEENVLERY